MSSCWVQLYFKEEDKPEDKPKGDPVKVEPRDDEDEWGIDALKKGDPVKVKPRDGDDEWDINALREAVKETLRNQLSHVDANELKVYESVDGNNLKNPTPLVAWADVPAATGDAPLIVTAPPPPPQDLQDDEHGEPPPKRRKISADLISSNWEAAVKVLREAFTSVVGVADTKPDPAQYCYPQRMETWKEKLIHFQLRGLRDTLSSRLGDFEQRENEGDRVGVVIGIRLGSGCGKTHTLVEAGKCLSQFPLLYVTYNLTQDLKADMEYPREALLIRLILAIDGESSALAGRFLNSKEGQGLLGAAVVTPEKLRDHFVSYAAKKFEGNDIVIGVDETKNLGEKAARFVISELGRVALSYKKATNTMCTALVTSLTWDNFTTASERSVELWTPPVPDKSTIEFFADGAQSQEIKSEQVATVLAAMGGRHMRSLVVARQFIRDQKVMPNVQALYTNMKDRLGVTLDQEIPKAIQRHVKNCINTRKEDLRVDRLVVPYTDRHGAIAPTLILLSFSDRDGELEQADSLAADTQQGERKPAHEIVRMFDPNALFCDSPKELEKVAKHYDFFRQSMSLPVVPANAKIAYPNKKGFKAEEWFRKLVFPTFMQEDTRSLLKVAEDSTTAPANPVKFATASATRQKEAHGKTTEPKGKKTKIVHTGVEIELGRYFHPKASNHPWIDRAFLARVDGDTGSCLVLAQDKVNASGFGDAVTNLNLAAALLSSETGIKDVLCIANVIGASLNTTAQSRFENPYILVRQAEVEDFFSVNFAPSVHFSRERHKHAARN